MPLQFFYVKGLKELWINKKSKVEQRQSSALFDVRLEEDAVGVEGEKEEIKGYRLQRSPKLVKERKKLDDYTCQACSFHFKNQIVHVHHLDPLCEYENPKETKIEDLITLCPNCHYVAHYWLRDSPTYKDRDTLLKKILSK
mgnify:CR=1 FL=1